MKKLILVVLLLVIFVSVCSAQDNYSNRITNLFLGKQGNLIESNGGYVFYFTKAKIAPIDYKLQYVGEDYVIVVKYVDKIWNSSIFIPLNRFIIHEINQRSDYGM